MKWNEMQSIKYSSKRSIYRTNLIFIQLKIKILSNCIVAISKSYLFDYQSCMSRYISIVNTKTNEMLKLKCSQYFLSCFADENIGTVDCIGKNESANFCFKNGSIDSGHIRAYVRSQAEQQRLVNWNFIIENIDKNCSNRISNIHGIRSMYSTWFKVRIA